MYKEDIMSKEEYKLEQVTGFKLTRKGFADPRPSLDHTYPESGSENHMD